MGRPAWSQREVVEDCRTLEIRWLSRNGYFSKNKSGVLEWGSEILGIGMRITIQSLPEEPVSPGTCLKLTCALKNVLGKTEFSYRIKLVTTPCNFGGVRHWFLCPLEHDGKLCERRASKLYMPFGGRLFGCRHCHDLTYRCQKEHDARVDALCKTPELVMSAMDNPNRGDMRGGALTLKAYARLTRKKLSVFETPFAVEDR